MSDWITRMGRLCFHLVRMRHVQEEALALHGLEMYEISPSLL
jgi:hypothetical protein